MANAEKVQLGESLPVYLELLRRLTIEVNRANNLYLQNQELVNCLQNINLREDSKTRPDNGYSGLAFEFEKEIDKLVDINEAHQYLVNHLSALVGKVN